MGARLNRFRSKQDYATPEIFIQAVRRYFSISEFAFDYAADATNAKAAVYWSKQNDSLSKSPVEWAHKTLDGWGWLNPPFSRIGPWAKLCAESAELGAHILLLVPAAVGSNWFRDYVHKRAAVYFLNGRIPFMPDKPMWLYPKDCILAVYSPLQWRSYEVWNWRQS